jgi:glycine betaine monooxygenase A
MTVKAFPTSLSGRWYTSPDVFEQEVERVFGTTWLYAGHESQLPDSGDFLTTTLVGENVILVRSESGAVNAFYDVCCHRGSRICGADAHGHRKKFVCPYHQWSYDLEGALIAAPRMGPDFDRSAYGLEPVQVASWNGFLLAKFSAEAPPLVLEPYFGAPVQAMDAFRLFKMDELKLAHSITYRVQANWKLVKENFLECYHCPGSHPELCSLGDLPRHFRWLERALAGHDDEEPDAGLRPGVKTHSLSGEYVSKVLIAEDEPKPGEVPVGQGRFGITTHFFSLPDYCLLYAFQPVSTTETDVRADWFVHRDAEEGRDYDVADVIGLWHTTNLQDWPLCEASQQGVSSRAYEPGPHSLVAEPGITEFLEKYLEIMGEPEYV